MRSKGQFPRRELPSRPLPRVSLLSASIRYREGEREREKERGQGEREERGERERRKKREGREAHSIEKVIVL